jgi:hypothetical protein
LLQGRFDPQQLQLRSVLWLFNDATVLGGLEEPQQRQGISLTARLYSVQGEHVTAVTNM